MQELRPAQLRWSRGEGGWWASDRIFLALSRGGWCGIVVYVVIAYDLRWLLIGLGRGSWSIPYTVVLATIARQQSSCRVKTVTTHFVFRDYIGCCKLNTWIWWKITLKYPWASNMYTNTNLVGQCYTNSRLIVNKDSQSSSVYMGSSRNYFLVMMWKGGYCQRFRSPLTDIFFNLGFGKVKLFFFQLAIVRKSCNW